MNHPYLDDVSFIRFRTSYTTKKTNQLVLSFTYSTLQVHLEQRVPRRRRGTRCILSQTDKQSAVFVKRLSRV